MKSTGTDSMEVWRAITSLERPLYRMPNFGFGSTSPGGNQTLNVRKPVAKQPADGLPDWRRDRPIVAVRRYCS